MVFRSESIDAIISYKWEKLQWYFYLQFLLRIAYVLSIFHTRNVYVVMSWSIWHSLLILNQICFSRKSFVVWFYYIWTLITLFDVIVALQFCY